MQASSLRTWAGKSPSVRLVNACAAQYRFRNRFYLLEPETAHMLSDLGITSFKPLGDFKVQSAATPDTFTSGVVVLQIAKKNQSLLWLRLGEKRVQVLAGIEFLFVMQMRMNPLRRSLYFQDL